MNQQAGQAPESTPDIIPFRPDIPRHPAFAKVRGVPPRSHAAILDPPPSACR